MILKLLASQRRAEQSSLNGEYGRPAADDRLGTVCDKLLFGVETQIFLTDANSVFRMDLHDSYEAQDDGLHHSTCFLFNQSAHKADHDHHVDHGISRNNF
jgi:hypothetical protein